MVIENKPTISYIKRFKSDLPNLVIKSYEVQIVNFKCVIEILCLKLANILVLKIFGAISIEMVHVMSRGL